MVCVLASALDCGFVLCNEDGGGVDRASQLAARGREDGRDHVVGNGLGLSAGRVCICACLSLPLGRDAVWAGMEVDPLED